MVSSESDNDSLHSEETQDEIDERIKKCSGDGSCLIECKCQHRSGEFTIKCDGPCVNGYIVSPLCPHNCTPDVLDLVKCPNYEFCGNWGRQQIFACFEGLCSECAIGIGKLLRFTTNELECPICVDIPRKLVILDCHDSHTICTNCWKEIYNKRTEKYLSCPFCRKDVKPFWDKL